MDHLMHPRLRSQLPAAARREPGPLAALWRSLIGSWQRARDQARQEAIDDATLRDLGLARCELGSFRAESEGRVARTRLRVAHRTHGRR